MKTANHWLNNYPEDIQDYDLFLKYIQAIQLDARESALRECLDIMNTQELRELDAWIAEHVMGFVRWNFNNQHDKFNYLEKSKERQCNIRRKGWIDGNRLLDTFPRYSTDPAAAMDVLQKCCQSTAFPVQVGVKIDGFYCGENLTLNECAKEAGHPTLPLAICLFAKKLFGKE